MNDSLRLGAWGSDYMGFNQFEGLVDFFNASSVGDYIEHCLPDILQVVRRLNEIRREHSSPLSHVYVLTSTLSRLLYLWIVGRPCLVRLFLSQEQHCVGVGIDMALAIDKAEVFVGNGVSSFPLSFLVGEWSF